MRRQEARGENYFKIFYTYKRIIKVNRRLSHEKSFKHFLFIAYFLGLLSKAFKNYIPKTPIDECWTFNNAKDYNRAIESGELAVEKYPENS
jgi:hypothetical protein